MLKIYKEKEKKEEVFYLDLVEEDKLIKLVACNDKGHRVKCLAQITPRGIYLARCAGNAGIATDKNNDNRIVVIE